MPRTGGRGYKADRKHVIGHSIVILLTAVLRGHGLSRITLLSREAGVKSNNYEKFINSTVRVSTCMLLWNYQVIRVLSTIPNC